MMPSELLRALAPNIIAELEQRASGHYQAIPEGTELVEMKTPSSSTYQGASIVNSPTSISSESTSAVAAPVSADSLYDKAWRYWASLWSCKTCQTVNHQHLWESAVDLGTTYLSSRRFDRR